MYAPGGQKVEPMAARSSHAQWRTFLSTLIEQEGVDTLTVKKAWTALNSQQLPSLNVYIYSVTVYSLDLHIVTPPVLELWTVIRTEQVLRSTLYST